MSPDSTSPMEHLSESLKKLDEAIRSRSGLDESTQAFVEELCQALRDSAGHIGEAALWQSLIDYPDAIAAVARQAYSQDDESLAMEICSQALDRYPEHENLLLARASGYLRLAEQAASKAQLDQASSNLDRAVADGEKLSRLQPQDPQAQLAAAELLARRSSFWTFREMEAQARKDLDSAIEKASLAIDLDPGSAAAYLVRAQLLEEIQEEDRSLADYSLALELEPGNITALNRRGLICLQRGDFEQALADFEKLVELLPEDAVAYRLRGDAHFDLWNPDAALADYAKALEIEPGFIVVRLNRASLYRALGQDEQALADLDRVLKQDEANAEALFERGSIQMDLGEFDKALADFERLVSLFPGSASAHRARGDAQAALGQDGAALADYSRALEIEPGNIAALNGRGLIYLQRGDFDLALADFEKLVEALPEDPVAYRLRGDAHLELGQLDAALADYDKALEIDPEFIDVRLNRASLLHESGQDEQALADLGRVLEQDEANAEALFRRALIWIDRQEFEKTLADSSAILEIDPENAVAHWLAGVALQALERSAEALESFSRAIELDPDFVDAYLSRGDSAIAQGDNHQAVLNLDRAVELDPHNADAYRLRALARLGNGDEYVARRIFDKSGQAYLAAKQDLERASELGLDDEVTHWYLGWALRALESYHAAVRQFDQAIEKLNGRDPGLAAYLLAEKGETFRLLADLLEEPEYYQPAIAAFEQALSTAPNREDLDWVENSKGLALVKLKRFDLAQAVFEQLLAADPKARWASLNLGQVHYYQERYLEALDCFEKALVIAEDDRSQQYWSQVGRGLCLERANRHEEAAQAYEGSLLALSDFSSVDAYLVRATIFEDFEDPLAYRRAESDRLESLTWGTKFAEALNGLAWFYLEKRPNPTNLAKSVNLAAQAVEIEKNEFDRANYVDTLGWAYYKLDDRALAKEHLALAVKLNPYDDLIRRHHEIVGQAVEKERKAIRQAVQDAKFAVVQNAPSRRS